MIRVRDGEQSGQRDSDLKPRSGRGARKRLVFYAVMLLIPLAVGFTVQIGYATYRTWSLYDRVKTRQRGWEGRVHVVDAERGFVPVRGARGLHVFPVGPDIPMRYDEDGFRVPVEGGGKPDGGSGPVLITLGGSFTYGDAVRAEDTYPALVAERLGGSAKNAGVTSYGLTQMLLAARDLVPRVEPDLLIVQYSAWLVDRATRPFAPSYFGLIPVPYFYGDEGTELHGPVFRSLTFDRPVGGYRHSPRSAIDFISFGWRVGLPLFLHDDYHMLYYGAGRVTGFFPQPTSNRDGLVRHVFSEMATLADGVDASLVIVVLGSGPESVFIPRHLLPASAVIVDAHRVLLEALPVRDRATYDRSYAHWRGEPPRIVDGHPNERAHDIIAGSIVDAVSALTGAR